MFEGKRVIAIGGGKGGVGKSVVAANLAVACAQEGKATVLVDADLGAPNLHTLLGVERPTGHLGDVLADASRHLEEIKMPCLVPNLWLVCGAGPILGVANPKFQKKQRLIRELNRLDAEVLVVDLGAGVSYNVLDFFNAADIRLVVITSQLTSMHNAYGFIKSALHRRLQRAIAAKPGYNELFDHSGWAEERLDQLLERVAQFDHRYLGVFEPLIGSFSIFLMGNMLESQKETNVLWAMQRMVQDFLGVECRVAGGLRRSIQVQRSINQRQPFMLEPRLDRNGEALRKLARELLRRDLSGERGQVRMALEAAEKLPKTSEAAITGPPEGDNGKRSAPSEGDGEGERLDEARFADELKGRQRVDTRYPAHQTIRVRIDGNEQDAFLIDLSRSGARISGLPSLEQGDRIDLRFPRAPAGSKGPPWIWAHALVRHIDEATAAAGCRFEDTSELRQALEALISRLAPDPAETFVPTEVM